jgi:adenosylcobinamide kinase/adenosylcobinamide-phosphate guanylyltransferase
MLKLIPGGARSGKSKLAQRLAASAGRVACIGTAVVDDEPEMAARIARHRGDQPHSWQTIEEPLALASAVERASKHVGTVLVDCLTIWLSNLSWEHRDNLPRELEALIHREIESGRERVS